MSYYVGTVNSTHGNWGWVTLPSVTMEDGSPHDLNTKLDIFIHRSDCDVDLQIGMVVKFTVVPDEKRGGDALRVGWAGESMRSKLERFAKGGVELSVQGLNNSRTLESSSVFVSWCVSADLAHKIKVERTSLKIVRFLFVHWPIGKHEDSKHEKRQLIDPADSMATIAFDSPGVHRLAVLVVFGESEYKLKDEYLRLKKGAYETDVISSDESGTVLKWNSLGSGCVEVEVPDGLFARKPVDWDWVNAFFKEPPRDQCQLRRRRLFAYTLQPIIALVAGIITGIWGALRWLCSLITVAILLLCGVRGMSYEPLRHPLDLWFIDVWMDGNLKRTVFIPEIAGKKVPFLLVASPPVLLTASLISSFTTDAPLRSMAFAYEFGTFMAAAAVLFGIITAIALWWQGIDWDAVKAKRRIQEREQMEEEMRVLVCTAGPRIADPWQLPFRPKTFRFYAAALKQKVCRGFAA